MAWRPNEQFIEGILDNSIPGKVTGWMRFAGLDEKVIFDLDGNFHRDIRGAKIHLRGDGESADREEAARYMDGFSIVQTGKVGDMTAGREPVDYVPYPYYEWYAQNGRVVIEFEPSQVEVIGTPIPAMESFPISREQQSQNMEHFLGKLASEMNILPQNLIVAGLAAPRMELLPADIRKQLPPLYGQDGKGPKAIAYVKFFTPTGSWSWFATEGSPVLDESQREIDFEFFGLVEGHEKKLGYFYLKELESVTGPLGLGIERDMYFTPKPLEEIAPEIFTQWRR